jgi:hypothetical protein
MKVKYVGKGAWMIGVPARDLNAEEVKKFGEERLLKSNLYEEVKRKSKAELEKPVTTNNIEE